MFAFVSSSYFLPATYGFFLGLFLFGRRRDRTFVSSSYFLPATHFFDLCHFLFGYLAIRSSLFEPTNKILHNLTALCCVTKVNERLLKWEKNYTIQ